jgi:hypothetical protein
LTARANVERISFAFAKEIGANVFSEFWPDIWRKVHHSSSHPDN